MIASFRHHAMRHSPRSNAGFTLLEFLIYLLITGLLLSAAVALSLGFMAAQAKVTARQEVERNGQLALGRVALEIREASGINSGDSVFGSDSGRLSLVTSIPATNPTVITLSGGRLFVQVGSGAVTPLTGSNISVESFRIDDLSLSGRSKTFRLTVRVRYLSDNDWYVAEETFETTAQVRRGHGFN